MRDDKRSNILRRLTLFFSLSVKIHSNSPTQTPAVFESNVLTIPIFINFLFALSKSCKAISGRERDRILLLWKHVNFDRNVCRHEDHDGLSAIRYEKEKKFGKFPSISPQEKSFVMVSSCVTSCHIGHYWRVNRFALLSLAQFQARAHSRARGGLTFTSSHCEIIKKKWADEAITLEPLLFSSYTLMSNFKLQFEVELLWVIGLSEWVKNNKAKAAARDKIKVANG